MDHSVSRGRGVGPRWLSSAIRCASAVAVLVAASAGAATAQSGPPPATTVVAPTGTSVPLQPTYVWNTVNSATYYLLHVMAGANTVVSQWYTSAQVCGASTCSVAPATVLGASSHYTVRVQTWNPSGYGPSTVWIPFMTGTPPAAPALIGPTAGSHSLPLANPTVLYRWWRSAGATAYTLLVHGPGGAQAMRETYTSASICNDTQCSIRPRTELVNGAHQWWVLPISPVGSGGWSVAGNFSIDAAALEVPPVLWPRHDEAWGSRRPTYRWSWQPLGSSATWFEVWVDRGGGTPIFHQSFFIGDICGNYGPTSCAVTPDTPLTPGSTYRFFIRPSNSRGTTAWSQPVVFTVATTVPAAATGLMAIGGGGTRNWDFRWQRTEGATWFYLWIASDAGVPVVQRWYRVENNCSETLCTAANIGPLPVGHNRFWIQTYNDHGYGPWSAPVVFTRHY